MQEREHQINFIISDSFRESFSTIQEKYKKEPKFSHQTDCSHPASKAGTFFKYAVMGLQILAAWNFEADQETPAAIWIGSQTLYLEPRYLYGKQDIVADLLLSLKSPLARLVASTLWELATAWGALVNALLAVASYGSYCDEVQNA